MSALTWFGLEVSLCLAIGFAVAGYLNPVLRDVLEHLCGTALAARFWQTFTRLMLLLVPLLLVLWPERVEAPPLDRLAELLRGSLLRTLTGLVLGLVAVAWNVWLFAAKSLPHPIPMEMESQGER